MGVSIFDPKRGALFTAASEGQAILHLSVESGRTYLIDFAVNSWEKSRYRMTAESGDQVYEDVDGNYQHVIAILKAKSLGWTQIALMQDLGPGFYLHSVAVTSTPRSDWTSESVPADGTRDKRGRIH